MGAGLADPLPRIGRLVGSGLDLGQDLTDGTGWRRVQIRAGRLPQLLLKPAIELGLGGGQLRERMSDVLSGHVDDEEVALRRLLDGPHLLGDAHALTARDQFLFARTVLLLQKGAGGLGLARQDRQREKCLVHSMSSVSSAADSGWPSPVSVACMHPRARRYA